MHSQTNGWNTHFGSLDELRRHMAGLWGTLPATAPSPDASIRDQGDAYVLEADVPGAGPDDVRLEVTGKGFVLGVETAGDGRPDSTARRLERGAMTFSRKVELPVLIDPDAVSASLEAGVLRIVFPKAPEGAPRKIAVNTR